MSLVQATLTLPAHLLPGGIEPEASVFGFREVSRHHLEADVKSGLTRFIFMHPIPELDEKQFDQAAEQFMWRMAKGTPYQVDKSFTKPARHECRSFFYKKNALFMEEASLESILTK